MVLFLLRVLFFVWLGLGFVSLVLIGLLGGLFGVSSWLRPRLALSSFLGGLVLLCCGCCGRLGLPIAAFGWAALLSLVRGVCCGLLLGVARLGFEFFGGVGG